MRRTSLTTARREVMRRIEVDATQVDVSGDTAGVPAGAFGVDGRSSSSRKRMQAAQEGGRWPVDDVS